MISTSFVNLLASSVQKSRFGDSEGHSVGSSTVSNPSTSVLLKRLRGSLDRVSHRHQAQNAADVISHSRCSCHGNLFKYTAVRSEMLSSAGSAECTRKHLGIK